MRYHKELSRETLKPKEALDILIEGNKRFVGNLTAKRDNLQMVSETRDNQFPFAAILSCSDSRVPTELVFDQGLGDIFSVRLAGNIASLKAVGSLEYACKYLGSKIIVVLGHTKCGGVIGACNGFKDGNIDAVISDILPAVHSEKLSTENRTSSNPEFVNNVIHLNVQHQMKKIIETSKIIRDMINEEKLALVGGVYDIHNGEVLFYEEDKIFCINSQVESIQKIVNS